MSLKVHPVNQRPRKQGSLQGVSLRNTSHTTPIGSGGAYKSLITRPLRVASRGAIYKRYLKGQGAVCYTIEILHNPIYVCISVHTYECTYVRMYVCTYVRTYVRTCVRTCVLSQFLGIENLQACKTSIIYSSSWFQVDREAR